MDRRSYPRRFAVVHAIALLSLVVFLPATGARADGVAGPQAGPVNVQVTDGVLNHGSAALVVDPLDPNRLSTTTTFHRYRPQCFAALTSNDGGMTWTRRACMTWDRSYRPEHTPTVAFGPDGSLYLAAIYWSGRRQQERAEVERSKDGGTTWSRPVPVVAALGPPTRYEMIGLRMAVDLNPGSPFFGRLYVGAVHDDFVNQDLAITVSVSADGGATWTTSGKLIDGGLNDEPHFAFGVDGTVFVSYAACYLWSGSSCRHRVDLELQRSIDGGSTWSGERRISSIRVRAGSTTYERLRRGNGPSVSLSPSIAIDDSTGPHAGRLYAAQMVWRMYRLRMELRYSNDRGDSWSDPVEVAPRPMHDQFLGSVAVSATGVLGITWLEQRHDRNDATYRTYQTVSTDGGVTFAGLAPVATTGSDPYLWGWSINEAASVWSGDRLVSAWPDTRTGALQIEFGWIS